MDGQHQRANVAAAHWRWRLHRRIGLVDGHLWTVQFVAENEFALFEKRAGSDLVLGCCGAFFVDGGMGSVWRCLSVHCTASLPSQYPQSDQIPASVHGVHDYLVR